MKFEKISWEIAHSNGLNEKDYEAIGLPKRATTYSAGYDFFIPYDIILAAGSSMVIPTGIKCDLDPDKVLEIYPRSGLGFKKRMRLANTVGIIDADYYNNENNEGHIMVKICNEGDSDIVLHAGDAFCQGVIKRYYVVDNDIPTNQTRTGGFGSTDK